MLRSPCSCVVSAWVRTAANPLRGHQPRRPFRPLDDVRHVEQVPVGLHREDRAHQVAGGILDALGEEGLVEMGVGFDGGGQQEMVREVDDRVARLGGDRRRDGLDRLAVDPDVDDVAADDRRALQDGGAHVCDDNDSEVAVR